MDGENKFSILCICVSTVASDALVEISHSGIRLLNLGQFRYWVNSLNRFKIAAIFIILIPIIITGLFLKL